MYKSILLTALLIGAPSALAQNLTPVSISVDPAAQGSVISKHIFGQFAEHLGHGVYEGIWVGPDSKIPNTRGIRKDVVNALKDIKVPNVRWPGGCYAEDYHWRKGIGAPDKRRATLNSDWGDVIETNQFGTHEFFDFLEQIGADAFLSANLGSGTVQEAAEWLEYMTADQPTALAQERKANGRDKPFKVAFWGIGNESWGCGGSMSTDYYTSLLKIYSRFNRNLDPTQTMQQIAVGSDGESTDYTEAVMKTWAEKNWSWDIQGLSMHRYTINGWPPSKPATGFGESDYASIIHEALTLDKAIQVQSAIMDKYDPKKKVALVIDEWGAWYAPTPGSPKKFLMQQNSQRDAILTALSLNIFARHADRVRVTNLAQMINVLQALIFTDGEKMLLTPTYYIYKMYVPFHDATNLAVTYDQGEYKFGEKSMPRVDALAVKGTDGKTWISISNIDPTKPVNIEVNLIAHKAKNASGYLLSAPKVDSVNSFENPQMVIPKKLLSTVKNGKLLLSLSPASVAVFSIDY